MGVRHYFCIIYVPDTYRKVITLKKRSDGDKYASRVDSAPLDLASRKEFEWYVFTKEELDEGNCCSYDVLEIENEAANYARELAAKHNLTFQGQSHTDGILD